MKRLGCRLNACATHEDVIVVVLCTVTLKALAGLLVQLKQRLRLISWALACLQEWGTGLQSDLLVTLRPFPTTAELITQR
jgi:hypothetical protein